MYAVFWVCLFENSRPVIPLADPQAWHTGRVMQGV